MKRKLLETSVGSESLTLDMPDGSTITVPWRTRKVEEGKSGETKIRTVRWPDFSALADPVSGRELVCDRCDGHPAHSPDQNLGAPRGGVVTIDVRRKGRSDREDDRIVRVSVACDCAYGAWVHKANNLPFVRELSGRELSRPLGFMKQEELHHAW